MLARCLRLAALAPLALAWTLAQQQVTAPQPETDPDEILTIEDPELITFGTEVRVVTVPVVVQGPNGEYVDGLEQSDFTVFDNGDEQKITGFDVSFLPISMTVCVQSSDRVEGMVEDLKETAVLFTDMVLGEFGEAAILSFDSRIRVLTDFSGDTEALKKALDQLTIGSSAIRISDCVYEGLRMLNRRPEQHKKVVVVISESQDNGSTISLGETLRTAQLFGVTVYPVYLSTVKARLKNPPQPPASPFPPGVNPLPAAPGAVATPTTQQQARYSATPNMIPLIVDLVVGVKNLIFSDALDVLSTGTGGKNYKPLTEEGIEEALVQIGQDLRSQYLLSYTPTNWNEGGLYHRIEVKTPYDQAKVRARPGYYIGPRPVVEGEPEFIDNAPR